MEISTANRRGLIEAFTVSVSPYFKPSISTANRRGLIEAPAGQPRRSSCAPDFHGEPPWPH